MSADSEGAIPSEALRESEADGAASAPPGSIISWLIDWSLRNRFLVACGTLLIIAWGIWAVRHPPVDAIPDLSENQVLVFADWSGRSPQEAEHQVTYPLSTNLQGLTGVKEVRASSMFGFSLLTVVFDDKVDNYFARTRVLERPAFCKRCFPTVSRRSLDPTPPGWAGFPVLSQSDPVKSSGTGRMRPRWFDLGAALAAGFLSPLPACCRRRRGRGRQHGGCGRQYQVAVDSGKMRQADVNLREVMDALASSNINVGGKVIERTGWNSSSAALGWSIALTTSSVSWCALKTDFRSIWKTLLRFRLEGFSQRGPGRGRSRGGW